MIKQDVISQVISALVVSPAVTLIAAPILQVVTKIVCGFTPKYWQAYRASLVADVSTFLLSFAISLSASAIVGMDFRLIIGICFLFGVYVEGDIYGRMIKNGSTPIGFNKALLVMAVRFLILVLVGAPIIAIVVLYPTIAHSNNVTINPMVIFGLILLLGVCIHLIYKIMTSRKQLNTTVNSADNEILRHTTTSSPVKATQEVIHQKPAERTLNTTSDNQTPKLSQKNEILDEYYEIALNEFQNGNTSSRVYAKAIALSDGDPNKERAIYVKLRAKEVADEATERQQKIKTAEQIVKINAYDIDGFTPLMRAVKDMNVNTIVSLMESGADPRILDRDFSTSTALDMAILKHNGAETEETRHCFQKIIDILSREAGRGSLQRN